MLVYSATALATTAAAPAARRPVGGTFKLSGEAPQATTASGGTRNIAGIDALLALQGVEDATERRKRAVRRGRSALDALDELKLGLLAGAPEPASLRRLQSAAADLAGESGDPRLDSVLAEIRLRADVELAKAGLA
jgi:hypothetical protein